MIRGAWTWGTLQETLNLQQAFFLVVFSVIEVMLRSHFLQANILIVFLNRPHPLHR